MLYKKSYSSYNEKRYSKPWGAIVTLDSELNMKRDFVGKYTGADGSSGDLLIVCEPGSVVNYDQKDHRNWKNNNGGYFRIAQPDGTLTNLQGEDASMSRKEAYDYLLSRLETAIVV